MTEQEKAKAIAEKEEQLIQLKQELKELKGPRSIMEFMKEKRILIIDSWRNDLKETRLTSAYGRWTNIRQLSVGIHGHARELKDMTPAQRQMSADMADEIVRINNKYMQMALKLRAEKEI